MPIQQTIVVNSKDRIFQHYLSSICDGIERGEIVAYPTETFYGLGTNPFIPEAVERIFYLKKRKKHTPLPLVVRNMNMVLDVVGDIPARVRLLMDSFWPGPLTFVLKCSPKYDFTKLSRNNTIGIRISSHPVVREILENISCPLISTSANISKMRDASSSDEVKGYFDGLIPYIIDAGKTDGKKGSTVISFNGDEIRVLREGAIPFRDVQRVYNGSH